MNKEELKALIKEIDQVDEEVNNTAKMEYFLDFGLVVVDVTICLN